MPQSKNPNISKRPWPHKNPKRPQPWWLPRTKTAMSTLCLIPFGRIKKWTRWKSTTENLFPWVTSWLTELSCLWEQLLIWPPDTPLAKACKLWMRDQSWQDASSLRQLQVHTPNYLLFFYMWCPNQRVAWYTVFENPTKVFFEFSFILGVPGFAAAMIRHLHSLRRLQRDHGWIHTLLEEAENERMHLMTFMALRNPGPIFRYSVILTQYLFTASFSLAYLINPNFCHRYVL